MTVGPRRQHVKGRAARNERQDRHSSFFSRAREALRCDRLREAVLGAGIIGQGDSVAPAASHVIAAQLITSFRVVRSGREPLWQPKFGGHSNRAAIAFVVGAGDAHDNISTY